VEEGPCFEEVTGMVRQWSVEEGDRNLIEEQENGIGSIEEHGQADLRTVDEGFGSLVVLFVLRMDSIEGSVLAAEDPEKTQQDSVLVEDKSLRAHSVLGVENSPIGNFGVWNFVVAAIAEAVGCIEADR
jgi:hypothetical protein